MSMGPQASFLLSSGRLLDLSLPARLEKGGVDIGTEVAREEEEEEEGEEEEGEEEEGDERRGRHY